MKIHFPRKDRKIISWAVVIMAYLEDADFPEDDDGSVNGVDVITVPLGRGQTAADLPDRHAPVGDAFLEGHVDIDHDRPVEDNVAIWQVDVLDDQLRRRRAIEVVPFELESHVDDITFDDGVTQSGLGPGDAGKARPVGTAGDEADVLLFPADRPDFFYNSPGQGKDGPAVAHAIRLESGQFGNEAQRHLRRFQFLVDVDQGDVVSCRHVSGGIVQQALAQGLDILGLDGKACCHGVAAELDEQVLGVLQGFVHIETTDAAA